MAKPPAQLKKPDFSGFVAGKLSGRTCGQLCGNQKTMAFVPASGMAERPKQLWTSKIRANVPASGTAKDVNLLRPSQNMDIRTLPLNRSAKMIRSAKYVLYGNGINNQEKQTKNVIMGGDKVKMAKRKQTSMPKFSCHKFN